MKTGAPRSLWWAVKVVRRFWWGLVWSPPREGSKGYRGKSAVVEKGGDERAGPNESACGSG